MAKGELQKETVLTAEGRLINQSFFKMDIYDEGGKNESEPAYRFEMAFDFSDMTGEGSFEDHVIAVAGEHWGISDKEAEARVTKDDHEDAIKWFWDGDRLAAKRKKNGKSGDVYEGKLVLRGKTIYNKNGDEGPGGVSVYDEANEEIVAATADKIYRGCVGRVAVVLNCYEDSKTDQKCISYYLVAFQKTGDGEKIVGSDRSSLFEPVGRKTGGRRSSARGED